MRVAVHQPNYLPWCGYFAKLNACDVFIFLDDAQISKASYVPRTKIRGAEGERWLTIPTSRHGAPLIGDVAIADDKWQAKHRAILSQTYRKAPYVDEVMELLEPIYEDAGTNVSDFNQQLIKAIAAYLGIEKPMHISSAFGVGSTRDERHIELVRKVRGTIYMSGAGGATYQEPATFEEAGISLEVRSYVPVPYEAEGFPFIPGLSIVDALFLLGRDAVQLLRYDQ